jgi:hypothetical protein
VPRRCGAREEGARDSKGEAAIARRSHDRTRRGVYHARTYRGRNRQQQRQQRHCGKGSHGCGAAAAEQRILTRCHVRSRRFRVGVELNAVARLQAVLCQPQESLYITVHINAGRGGSRATDTRRINSYQKFGNLLNAAGAAKHVPALLVTCHRYRVASKATESTDTGLSGLGFRLAWGHEFGPSRARDRRG